MTRTYDLDELQRLDDVCRQTARDLGFEPPEVVFHLAPADRVYDLAARGLPGRYAHWRFGRDFERLRLAHDHGQARIYELVLNTRPYQAYLLEGNSWAAQLLVIAHVYGHAWFFEHNEHFRRADRRFLHRVRAGAERMDDHGRRHGVEAVEDLVDAVQALSVHAPTVAPPPSAGAERPEPPSPDPYEDLFPEEAARRRAAHDQEVQRWRRRFPRAPERDLLGFILEHGHRLEPWERDIVSLVREEAAYFLPQRRTKIANEGFAVWLHQQIVQSLQLPTDEFLEFARLDATVTQPHPLTVNPYNLGLELWREVVRIHDAPTAAERERFPAAGHMAGVDRVRELASVCDDAALVAEFLGPEVCERCGLFAWRRELPSDRRFLKVTTREADEVRALLLRDLRSLGVPTLEIVDADALGRGALWLVHRDEGVGLDREYALGTLPHVVRLWGRTVVLESSQGSAELRRPVWYVCEPGGTPQVRAAPPEG
jgi:stage V sporulation protein R